MSTDNKEQSQYGDQSSSTEQFPFHNVFETFDKSDEESINDNIDALFEEMQDKCSICFTSESEIDLQPCGDQFCYSCIEQFWIGKLEESVWGIRKVHLYCPVCKINVDTDVLTLEEWSSEQFIDIYQKSLYLNKTLYRSCPICNYEQPLSGESKVCVDEKMLKDLLNRCFKEPMKIYTALQTKSIKQILHWLQVENPNPSFKKPSIDLVTLQRYILSIAEKCLDYDDDDHYTEIQIASLKLCAGSICDQCKFEFCFRCGKGEWHGDGESCYESLRKSLLENPNDINIMWMVSFTKGCPYCGALICKDQDGGCNQIGCTRCGHSFCWICLRKWSTDCGFFKCGKGESKELPTEPTQALNIEVSDRTLKSEAGIPDVTKIPSFSPLH